MKSAVPRVLAINGGSSSIRFAVHEAGEALRRRLAAADHRAAVRFLLDWLEAQPSFASVEAVGHRAVHGMKHSRPERVTARLIATLRRMSPLDPEHLPREIALIEAFSRRHPGLAQVACFDTAFHGAMPPVARWLPIPRSARNGTPGPPTQGSRSRSVAGRGRHGGIRHP